MLKFELKSTKEDFTHFLKSKTYEGSALLYNSPFRVLYFLSSSRKEPFLGYVFSNNFSITRKSFSRLGMHSLDGNFDDSSSTIILKLRPVFSRLLLVFYAIWILVIFGIASYSFIKANYVATVVLTFIGLLSLLFLYVHSYYLKKSDLKFFKEKMSHLIEEIE